MQSRPWQPASRAQLLEQVPCGVVVIDRSLTIVDANRSFADLFGGVVGQPCFSATRGRSERCPSCAVEKTFADGMPRAYEQSGRDRDGRPADYLVQVTPIRDEQGSIRFAAAVMTDLTATKALQREYQTLFEKVPCYVTVINRDFRVVRANQMFREVFGDTTGEHCHVLYKRSHERCRDCAAEQTFRDGQPHTANHVGITRHGRKAYYVVSTAPLMHADGEVSHVIEMAVDVTQARRLEAQLEQAGALREVLVEHAPFGMLVLDHSRHIVLANREAERLLGRDRDALVGAPLPRGLFPDEVRAVLAGRSPACDLPDTALTVGTEAIPAAIVALRLETGEGRVGTAIIVRDLRELRRLEREKLEAERLAAVGHTVAGLAHGIKNILTGLEGGMYVTSTGLKRNDDQRLRQGWEMLERNIGKISSLVKNLLAFSRGEKANVAEVEPAAVVTEVVELFRESAEQHGLKLLAEAAAGVAPAPLDRDGIHTCLANLLSNSIDACLVSNNPSCTITVRLREADEALIFEISDSGCGMDYEVKQRVFTSFFTTKGVSGTGIGLLLTRKIVQQHGGSITFESTAGIGTTFRLTFPRARLPRAHQPATAAQGGHACERQ